MGENRALHRTSLGSRGDHVVLLHGLFGQGRNWLTIAKQLAETHRVHLVDLPHHGRSPWFDRFDMKQTVDKVLEALPDDEPVALIGHSLGGRVAMMLSLLEPHRVERLVIVDISPVDYDTEREFAGYAAGMKELDLERVARRADAERLLEPAVPDGAVRSFLLQNLRRDETTHAGWSWQLNLEVLDRDLSVIGIWPGEEFTEVSRFPGPVLWVAGECSDYVKPEHGAAMTRLFPQVDKITIDGAGHWLHSEKPDDFVTTVARFLAEPARS